MDNILVIRLSALGDLVLSTRYVHGLRVAFPQAQISLLTSPMGAALFDGMSLFDEVIIWRRGQSVFHDIAFLGGLVTRRYDMALDLHSNVATGFALSLVRAKWKNTLGQKPLSKLFGLKHTQPPKSLTQVLAEMEQLPPASIATDSKPLLTPSLVAQQWADQICDRLLVDKQKSLILLAPGSSPAWQSKRWPTAHFANLVDKLVAAQQQPILIGGPEDAILGAEIMARSTGAIDLTGATDLSELVALAARADAVVAHDSGPMHLAAATGTPTLALFGATDATAYGPNKYHGKQHGHLTLDIDCSPCHQKQCPLGHHRCMNDMSVNLVFDGVQQLLSPMDPQ